MKNYSVLLGSQRFDKINGYEKSAITLYQNGQEKLRNKKIIGIKISIKEAGTLSVIKCIENFYHKTPELAPAVEEIKQFEVVKGINYLMFDNPIILTGNEALGINANNSSTFYRGNNNLEGNLGYKYWNNNNWIESTADIVMAYLVKDVIEATQQELEATQQELEATQQELEATQQELEATQQELEATQQELEVPIQFKHSYYIRYSDGAKIGTGSYFSYIELENNAYIKLTVTLGCKDRIPAGVAFYRDDTYSEESYIKEASVQITKNIDTYNVIIPKEAKRIVITNRNDIVPNNEINLKIFGLKTNQKLKDIINQQEIDLESEEYLGTLSIIENTYYSDLIDCYLIPGDIIRVHVENVVNYVNLLGVDKNRTKFNIYSEIFGNNNNYYCVSKTIIKQLQIQNVTKQNGIVKIYKIKNPTRFYALHQDKFGYLNIHNRYNSGIVTPEWLDNKYWIYQYDEFNLKKLIQYTTIYRKSTKIIYGKNIHLKITLTNPNYKFYVYGINNIDTIQQTLKDYGWVTFEPTEQENENEPVVYTWEKVLYDTVGFCLTLAKNPETSLSGVDYLTESGIQIEILENYDLPNIPINVFQELENKINSINIENIEKLSNSNQKKIDNNINKEYMFNNQPCYGHLFIDMIYGNNPAIPCQSLFDVDATNRLGMTYIETNVQRTADNVLIPIHGISGKFGKEVTDLNGEFTYEDTYINSVTYNYIAENIRYNSKYGKHRTTIPTLEDVMRECKRRGMSVMMSWSNDAYNLAKKYFDDNFIAYNGNRNTGFTGIIMHWSSLNTKESILQECDNVKPPYIHMMNPEALATFANNGTLEDLTNAVHEKGCMLGIAGCYQSTLQIMKFLESGGDVLATGSFVNDFPEGNICNLKGDISFDDFETNSIVNDGILILEEGQTISSKEFDEVYLGKGSLRLRFNGSLKINKFGHRSHDNVIIESDGNLSKWISTYFLEQKPTFKLTATQRTEIYMINYKASKC